MLHSLHDPENLNRAAPQLEKTPECDRQQSFLPPSLPALTHTHANLKTESNLIVQQTNTRAFHSAQREVQSTQESVGANGVSRLAPPVLSQSNKPKKKNEQRERDRNGDADREKNGNADRDKKRRRRWTRRQRRRPRQTQTQRQRQKKDAPRWSSCSVPVSSLSPCHSHPTMRWLPASQPKLRSTCMFKHQRTFIKLTIAK